jgi:hypothetical protein
MATRMRDILWGFCLVSFFIPIYLKILWLYYRERVPTRPQPGGLRSRYDQTLNLAERCLPPIVLPRKWAVSVQLGPSENVILAPIGAQILGRGLAHVIIPALVEERLSYMYNGTGVRGECAEVNDKSGSPSASERCLLLLGT